MIQRFSNVLVFILTVLLLAACSSRPPPRQAAIVETPYQISGQFPRPAELEPQIAFWRNVYGVWSRRQVALHDDRYLGLVYEVVSLPGGVQEGMDSWQTDAVSERRQYWQYRLRELEGKTRAGLPLDSSEQALAAHIAKYAGSQGIYGASERVRAQRGLRERFRRGLEISGRYDAAFRAIFREAGLPEDLAYLPHVESSFQANARSSAGAVGVWQFTRPAARVFMTVNEAVDERLDPVASARGAARYLQSAYGKLGAWPLALTSYNHGIGGMQRAKSYYGHDFMRIVKNYDHPQFGFASRNFYAEFLAAREVAQHPERFFPEGVRYEPPLNHDRVVLRQDTALSSLASQYGVDRWRLIDLNPAWRDSVQADRALIPAGTEVWLPPGSLRRVAQGT